jgi:predicted nucleic acid-binding protein
MSEPMTIPPLVVLDCTITVPWYLTDEANALSELLFEGLGRSTYLVPVLWRLEFISAMRAAHRRGRIPSDRVAAIFDQVGRLPLRQQHLMLDVLDIAEGCERFGLTPYDYVYLALAREHAAPLATMDMTLIRACQQAGVPVLTDPTQALEPTSGSLPAHARPVGGLHARKPRRANRPHANP